MLERYSTRENANEYEIEMKFVQEGERDSYSYELIIPNELSKQGILEEKISDKLEGNSLDFTYLSQIDLVHFEKNDFTNISYDLLIIQKNELDNKSFVIASIYIPLAESLTH